MKGLYHYTSTWHLPQILNDGYLRLTRGVIDDMAVWLTTTTTSIGNGLEGSVVDKGEIRFILKDIRVIRWRDYKKKIIRGKDIDYKKEYVNALETGQKPHTWWLVTDCIDLINVEAIENTKTGKRINLPATINEILKELK